MDINPLQSAMEFLDLSDANDDEKAEAMAIIGSAPLRGVEFPFEFKASSHLSERLDYSSQTQLSGPEGLQSGPNSRPTSRQKSPIHEFVESHSSEVTPQTSGSLSQWEISPSPVMPVVCGPPQYHTIYQTQPHYYPTNAPMAAPFYSPVTNGQMGPNFGVGISPKEVKLHSSSSHNSSKPGKAVHATDIRTPFVYSPHNQFQDVPQFDASRPPPTTIVSDGMILTNGPPVQPIFSPVQPGFPHTFLPPHTPFPTGPMYIVATPEGSFYVPSYALPPGIPMTRPNEQTRPPSVPNEDISAINPNVPSNDGNDAITDNEEVDDGPQELNEVVDVESNCENQNVNNDCDNQNFKLSDALITESKVDAKKVSDDSKPVTNSTEMPDSGDASGALASVAGQHRGQDDYTLSSSTSPVSGNSTNATANSGGSKSWADLFKKGSHSSNDHSSMTSNLSSSALRSLASGPIVSQSYVNSMTERDSPPNSSVAVDCESERSAQIHCIPMRNDPFARKLAKRVKDLHLKHYLPYLVPYGLVNRGNWCYINATLQALVGCPPFYNLMREIADISGLFRERSSTPIIDSFAKFFTHFTPSDHLARRQRALANASIEDLPKGEPIEPRCIYDVLGSIKSECLKGRQEDAEEFLSSVLNGLHEEMVSLLKLLNTDVEQAFNGDHVTANGHIAREENGNNLRDIDDNDINDDEDDENLWKEVSSRHKAMPTRTAKIISTPIVTMFGGSTVSVRTAGKEQLANRQPFFTLQLDIQSDRVKSVDDALKCLTTPESIQGYMCPKTKQAMDASAQTFLDTLPPILILHLKLFVYDMDGGCRKLMKRIDYPVDLDLPRECLQSEKNNQLKKYKLLSVVYHDGAEAIKGHYVTDVYHIGSNQWLRCDDGSVKVIPIAKVLNTETSRTPYLLFYRRFDTLSGKHLTHTSNHSKTYSH